MQDLQDNERVRAQLNAGLNVMNSAMDQASAPPTASYPQAEVGGHPYGAAGYGAG